MSNARSPRASCSMTIGTRGMAAESTRRRGLALVAGLAASGLALARAPLRVEPTLLRGARGLGRAPRARHPQRVVEPGGEPLQRQRPVARLAARVLRDRGHPRPAARHHAALLLV